MPNFRLLTGLFICAAMLCAAAAPAAAQQQEDGARAAKSFYQYDKKYRRSIHDNDSQDISVLGQGLLHLTLLRDESDPPGDFMLRLSSPVSVSGCADIGHPEITMHKSSSALFFTLKEGTATAEKIRATRYPHYQCNTKAQLAYIDIPLNRDDLIKNNIKKIHMKNKSGLTYHDLEIEADQNKITMRGPLGEETRCSTRPARSFSMLPQ